MPDDKHKSKQTRIAVTAGGRTAGRRYQFFHGTDLSSALALLNADELDGAAATIRKLDGPDGFFLAKDVRDAGHFASWRSPGAVIRLLIRLDALTALLDAGAVLHPIPRGLKAPRFAGMELYIPTSCFEMFNERRGAGEIEFKP